MLDAVRCALFVRAALVTAISTISALGCGGATGGSYEQGNRLGGDVDHGETNGRRFDFVSNKPEEDEWQIRITGNSMWVSYAKLADSDKLGSINLTDKETAKVWKLIDAVDIPSRKKGKKDEDEGYVSLQLKEPGDEGGEVRHVYISRAAEDEDLTALAVYLQELTAKYKKEKPNF